MTDKEKNKNRKKSLIISSIVKMLLILLTVSYCCNFYVKLDTWESLQGPHNCITVMCDDEEIICKYITEKGELYSSLRENGIAGQSGKEIAVPANKRVRWGPRYYMDNDCINILLFKEEITVGYIVIEVKRDDTNTYNHSATVIQQSSVRMTVLELLIRNVF